MSDIRWRSPESSERTKRFWRLIKENVYYRRYREAPVMNEKDVFGKRRDISPGPQKDNDKSWGQH